MDEILAVDADCVLYNPPTERYSEIIPILASGKNVISIIAGWNPKKRNCYQAVLDACETGQSSLYGTGLNPGLSYELALLASSICTDVDSIYIKTCEPQASLSEVFLQMFGFGKTEEELSGGARGAYGIFAKSLHEVTDLLCEELGLPHDGTGFTYEFEPATQRLRRQDSSSRRERWLGCSSKHRRRWATNPVATIELRFLLGSEYVRESWLADGPRHGWLEVDVKGTPGSRLTHEIYAEDDRHRELWSTGTKAINAIPFVCAAKPGLLSHHSTFHSAEC